MFNKEHWRPIFRSHKRVTDNNFQVTCQQRLWCGNGLIFYSAFQRPRVPHSEGELDVTVPVGGRLHVSGGQSKSERVEIRSR